MEIFGVAWNVILACLFGMFAVLLAGRVFFTPLKLIFRFMYYGLIGGLMLWAVNFIGAHIGFVLGINPVTALLVGFLGVPGMIMLILFKIFIVA